MNTPREISASVRSLTNGITVATSATTVIVFQPSRAQILEMEDVLFHLNSAVMMPTLPQGPSSTQGRQRDPAQHITSGLEVIRAVFVYCKRNPEKKIVLAGHADRSGPAAYNFELSSLRAQTCCAVLIQDRQLWIDTVTQKNRVEDYKQIFKHVYERYTWQCDPGPVNNQDDKPGRDATEGFQRRYNKEYAQSIPETGAMDAETWGAVFDVYMRELSELMAEVGSPDLASWRRLLKFVDGGKPFVGCGESIPIDSPGNDGLRSQTNRRVEFVFFDPGEEPILVCPPPGKTPHKRDDCPIYSDFTARDYIPPGTVVPSKAYSIKFYADTDHTGKVEETDAEWDNRRKRPGCVIVFNCDRDSAKPPKLDFQDSAIGNDKELQDFARLVIKANPDLAADCEAIVSISDADAKRFRGYDAYAVGARPVLGKAGSVFITELKLADIRTKDYVFALELLEQLKEIETDTIRINVIVRQGNKDVFHDYLLCSLAPWLQMSNLDEAETVYVARAADGSNKKFLAELTAILGPGKLHIFHPTLDVWVQDVFEMGFAVSPPTRTVPMHQFINSANSLRDDQRIVLYGVIKKELIGPDCGHIEIKPSGDRSMDSFGNLDCSPPFKEYPFGRLYYGIRNETYAWGHLNSEMNKAVVTMLKSNKFQPAVEIPTNWLWVGHVDEFLGFVPNLNAGAGEKEYKLLVASPKCAIDICNAVPDSERDSTVMCRGKPGYEMSVRRFLANEKKDGYLRTLNENVEGIIKSILTETVKPEFDIVDDDIIFIPVIFNGTVAGPRGVEYAIGRTSDMVNCLVAKPHVIIPKPFGPQHGSEKDLFEADAEKKLTPLGISFHFVDDWVTYHAKYGEIHCGTNAKRAPPSSWMWWDRSLRIGGKNVHI